MRKSKTTCAVITKMKTQYYIGDVRDISSIRNAMYGVDYVFHVAAKTGAFL